MEFSRRLRSLRAKNAVGQGEPATTLGVGKSTISAYENDKTKPSVDVLSLLADYFEVSVDYLLCRTDYPKTLTTDDAQMLAQIKENDRLQLTKEIMDLLRNMR